jgi:hypothetical protein
VRIIRNTLRLIVLFAVPMAATALLFQNCSRVRVGSSAATESSKGGGTGTDGKTYAGYAKCPDGTVGVASIVKIANASTAILVRENCQTLSTPKPVALGDLQFAAKDSSVMTFKGQVYDQQTNQPKLTMEICQASGASVEAKVWQVSGDSGSLYGSVTQADGAATGTLNVAPPGSSAPLDFATVAGQSSSFDLALASPASGSLTYTLSGGSPVSVPTVSCLSQPLPSPFPNTSNTGVPSGKVLSQSGGLTVTVDGTVIDSKLVTGCIDVQANNVTIKNSRILGGTCARPVSISAPYDGLIVMDSEIDGQNTATCSEAIGGGGYTLLHVYEHGCDQGPRLEGPLSITIQDSYIANKSHGSQAYHFKLNTGKSVRFIHNTIATANGPAIFLADNSTGDVIIDSNLLVANQYSLTLYDNHAWVQNNLIYDGSEGSTGTLYGPVSAFFGDKNDPGVTIMEWTNNHLTPKRDGSSVGALLAQPAP